MAKAPIADLPPWKDRWRVPTVESMIEPYKETQQKILHQFIDGISVLEGVTRGLVWHGPSWRWTMQFDLAEAAGNPSSEPLDPLALIVFNPELHQLCVPLREWALRQIPIKRLHRFVRDQIRPAKRAVDIHWALLTPNTPHDAEQSVDLVRRKHKLLMKTG